MSATLHRRGSGRENVITQFSVPGAAEWDIMILAK
jgi:hypothetical protein